MQLARQMLGEALRWRERARRRRCCAATSSARELGIAPGPRVGELLEELAEAQYAGEIATREQALDRARLSRSRSSRTSADRSRRSGSPVD